MTVGKAEKTLLTIIVWPKLPNHKEKIIPYLISAYIGRKLTKIFRLTDFLKNDDVQSF